LVLEQAHYLQWYGRWLRFLHPNTWTEVRDMVRKYPKEFNVDYDFIAENMDWDDFFEKGGMQRIVEILGPKKAFKLMDADWLLAHLPPEEIKKLKERLK